MLCVRSRIERNTLKGFIISIYTCRPIYIYVFTKAHSVHVKYTHTDPEKEGIGRERMILF